ncbi:DNA uptake porin HofQ [Mixta intestinalis]|uniref:Type IV pilus biogenesis and competence protein PilQ n=1 Tax=Mixta intestinalis TaxID=1615494 RepID=A0A6P1Q4Z4_9GAMM|nr:DNA uptake porin HofQ [Mixta intestinalis]QHM73511.1 Type IV pilus biogenesis and competence protein PilQ [Mixta intestinalis]
MRIGIVLLWLLSAIAQGRDEPLSVAFQDAPIEQVLQALADYQQLNLMVAPGVEGQMTLRLQAIPWRQALNLVARMGRLTIEQQGTVLLVFPQSWQEAEKEERAQQQPLQEMALTLQHAEVTSVNASLQSERAKLMTERGSVTVDTRANMLLLRDTPAALNSVAAWVHALDVPLQQVELTAHIVSMSETHLRELGVSWQLSGEEMINQALRNPTLNLNLGVSSPSLAAGLTLARLDGRLLNLELSALEQENQIEIIASPRLIASHQQPASIKQGTEIPYEVSSGSDGATSIEFKEAVLGMDVTPVVQPNGRIRLALHISQNVPGRNINNGDREILTINKQEITTQVTLREGQTLALGGIFQQESSRNRDKVPLLGDIPLLGALFRHDIQDEKRRELMIFITPRLVHEE